MEWQIRGSAAMVLLFASMALPAWGSSVVNPDWEARVLATPLAGHIAKVPFYSEALEQTRSLYVYTPPGFSLSAARTFPVIVFLHGAPGNALDWPYKGHAHKLLDDAIRDGKFPAALAVFADGVGPYYRDGSEWADSVDGRCRMESSVVNDLTLFMRTRYHASSNAAFWSLCGLSEGGFGAANLTVRHPDRFHNAVVMSGDFQVSDSWPDARDIFGDNPVWRRQNSPMTQIERIAPAMRHMLHFFIALDDGDSRLEAQTIQFIRLCNRLEVPVRYIHQAGQHNWRFWGSQLAQALPVMADWLRGTGVQE